jgi:hypothetical protein
LYAGVVVAELMPSLLVTFLAKVDNGDGFRSIWSRIEGE